jgi:hypothetical protein
MISKAGAAYRLAHEVSVFSPLHIDKYIFVDVHIVSNILVLVHHPNRFQSCSSYMLSPASHITAPHYRLPGRNYPTFLTIAPGIDIVRLTREDHMRSQ